MSGDVHSIAYGSQKIQFELHRTNRRTLAIHVHPDKRVEVVAPKKSEISKIYEKVKKRAKWIKTQQIYFDQFPAKAPERKYVSGENHRYLGRQLRLKIRRDIMCGVKLSGQFLLVSAHYPNNPKHIKGLTDDWFKERARCKFKERLALCLEKFPNTKKFIPQGTIIRHLSNRWGSMTSAKRLVLNTKLIHMPVVCLDYVIIHELCHIQHPNHSPKFWKLLTKTLPDWKKRKKKLEECPA